MKADRLPVDPRSIMEVDQELLLGCSSPEKVVELKAAPVLHRERGAEDDGRFRASEQEVTWMEGWMVDEGMSELICVRMDYMFEKSHVVNELPMLRKFRSQNKKQHSIHVKLQNNFNCTNFDLCL